MKKMVLAIVLCTFSGLAFANECLRNASNSALIQELENRLNGGNSSETGLGVVAYCNSYTMSFSQFLANGEEVKLSFSLTTAAECSRQLAIMGQVQRLSEGRVAHFCEQYTMQRVLISKSGIRKVDSVVFGTQVECEAQAKAANSVN